MPFISSTEVAAMRKAIRAALPEFKVSVTRRHHTEVDVRLMSGPIAPVPHVNVFWYKEKLASRPDVVKVVDTILAEIKKVKTPRIVSEDSDYGSIPNYYYNIDFGTWDKIYQQTEVTINA